MKNTTSQAAYSKLVKEDGGKDGAREYRTKIKISATRSATGKLRCRPGTFEWRYGRDRHGPLFLAGNHYAILWERAGIAIQSSANFSRGARRADGAGISDARAMALDDLRGIKESVGQAGVSRLHAYCVEGRTADEIAQAEGQSKRAMATVLDNDLRQCAIHFRMLPDKRHRNG